MGRLAPVRLRAGGNVGATRAPWLTGKGKTMPVSEQRVREYREYRRRYPNRPANVAAWATSQPRYDVNPYDDDQKVVVAGEVFRVRFVVDEMGWELFREDVDNGFYSEDDAPFVTYYGVVVSHPRTGLTSSVWGVSFDDREYLAERALQDVACDVIDEVREQFVARPALLV